MTSAGDADEDIGARRSRHLDLARRLRSRRRGSPTHALTPCECGAAEAPPTMRDELAELRRALKRLEHRHAEDVRQLASDQRKASTEHSADLFRQALSAAVVNAAPPTLLKDALGALAQFVPVAQNFSGGAASFATKPVSTLAVPAVALGLYALRQPRTPVIITNNLNTSSRALRVTVISPDGGNIHYELGAREVTRASPQYGTYIDVPRFHDGKLRVRAFLLLRASETAEVQFTYARMRKWILHFGSFFG
jgi:hypothetical protein